MLRLVPWLIYLAAAAGFILWSVSRTFHVGQMVLPRGEAAAIALAIVVVVSLVLAWGWLLFWNAGRWLSPSLRDARSWVDRPLVRWSLLGSLLAGALLFSYGRWIEPRWVAVRTLRLGQALPAGERPLRLAVISDLHAERWRRPWQGLAEAVNATAPDVILFLGDTLNRADALPHARRALAAMHAPHKLAVRGNWDVWYWSGLPLLEGTGFEWVDDRRVTLELRGQRLHLIGLRYRDERGPALIGRSLDVPGTGGSSGALGERLLAGARSGWRVLLHHTPDLIHEVPSADLYLAGHTHGGQIELPLYGPLVTLSRHGRRYARGLHQVGATRLYTHPGIGVEPIIPLRLGVRPEVTVFELGRPPR